LWRLLVYDGRYSLFLRPTRLLAVRLLWSFPSVCLRLRSRVLLTGLSLMALRRRQIRLRVGLRLVLLVPLLIRWLWSLRFVVLLVVLFLVLWRVGSRGHRHSAQRDRTDSDRQDRPMHNSGSHDTLLEASALTPDEM
jgi:hypothetical protein